MLTIRQLTTLLEEDYSLKLVTQAYSEIAAIKVRKIRNGIQKNREFFEEVSHVYHSVKETASKKNISLPTKAQETLSIIITSNHRFYATLEDQLLEYFVANTGNATTDRIVLGKTGALYLKTKGYKIAFKPLVLQNDLPNPPELRQLTDLITRYNQVFVYHSKMKTVLVQQPSIIDVTQTQSKAQARIQQLYSTSKATPIPVMDFIFEPDLSKMLQFFETQISTLLLEQAFLESELSRTASRLISMDQAQSKADGIISTQKKQLAEAKKSMDNTRLLETVATFSNWRREHAH